MKKLVHGVVPPMITVFRPDGTIDEQGTRRHVRFLIDGGVDAISVGGSTGEFIALTLDERKRLTELVLDEVNGRIPVYPGTAHYSTKLTIELTKHAQQSGAEGVLIIPPYYLNPPKHDVYDHFRAVREATDISIILYNNLWFAGYEFDPWEVQMLCEEDVLHGIKCAHGDPWKVHTIRKLCQDKMTVYYGHDVNGLEALLVGADGWLTGLVNLVPRLCVNLFQTVRAGNLESARKQWDALIPLVNFVCVNRKGNYPHFVQIFKDGLKMRGQDVGNPVPPLSPLREEELGKLRSLLGELGLLDR